MSFQENLHNSARAAAEAASQATESAARQAQEGVDAGAEAYAQMKDEGGSQVSAAVTQAIDAMRRVVDELSRLAAVDPSETVAALKGGAKAASAQAQDLAQGARGLSQARIEDLGDAVRRNPLAWLAAALGLGLIVGMWNRGGRS